MKSFLGSVGLVALAATVLAVGGRALAAADGDLWEVTTQMTMEGMPAGMGMPASTRQVCTSKDWSKPPVNNERNCQFTDFQRTPAKATWKMSCEGMTGEGEITRTSPDAYQGWMRMATPQGAMTMNLSGRRLGDCDAGEAKKTQDAQIAKIQAQSAAAQQAGNDAMKQMCLTGANALDLRQHHMYESLCTTQGGYTAESYKVPFCDNAKTYDGFKMTCHRGDGDPDNSFDAVAKFCGTTTAALSAAACPQALKTEDFDLMHKCCPNEAKAYAVEKCAGLSYTGAGPIGGFCATYAADVMDGGKNAPAAPPMKRVGKSGR